MEEFVVVCSLDDLISRGGRYCCEVEGRPIVIFYLPLAAKTQSNSKRLHSGYARNQNSRTISEEVSIHAIDYRCYHTGGPLAEGDIEDIGGVNYVICPWHSYIISLLDGNSIYYNMERKIQSKGIRQRVHQVKVESDHVLVKLSKLPGGNEDLPSDHYCPATEEEKRRLGIKKLF